MKIISKDNPIAFFDSGVGGLTVYSKLKELLPNESYIYFGDTKHMPYGEKTEEELLGYATKIINFFIEKNAKAVVMACNTTSSIIYDKIKDKYDIKIYPIIQSVANIISKLPINKIGVFATPATINSNAYKREINKYNKNIEVIQIACPEWVKIVENNEINRSENIQKIKEKFEEMNNYCPDKIILGCTHYPYLLDVLTKFTDKNRFIDPAIPFAQFIKNDLQNNSLINNTNCHEEFYVSADPDKFINAAQLFHKLNKVPQLTILD